MRAMRKPLIEPEVNTRTWAEGSSAVAVEALTRRCALTSPARRARLRASRLLFLPACRCRLCGTARPHPRVRRIGIQRVAATSDLLLRSSALCHRLRRLRAHKTRCCLRRIGFHISPSHPPWPGSAPARMTRAAPGVSGDSTSALLQVEQQEFAGLVGASLRGTDARPAEQHPPQSAINTLQLIYAS